MYRHAGPRALVVRLSPPVRREFQRIARWRTGPFRVVQRARLALYAARGWTNADIARILGFDVRTVRTWRRRLAAAPCVATLQDEHRSGRPPEVPTDVHAVLVSLACDRPDGQPFRERWTRESLSAALLEKTGYELSVSEIGRVLRSVDLRPHRVKMWLHSPDPDFVAKARRVCDLYLNPPAGAAVVCVDEKTGMQALERAHPGRTALPGQLAREEFEYIRHGTRTLIASFDVRTGEVFGQVRRRTGAGIVKFMDALAEQYPTGDVYVVWDNLNIHFDGRDKRWTRFNQRHGGRFHFVYTPLHASWLNQIEMWFSILHRRVLKGASFTSGSDLAGTARRFITHWNRRDAHPFRWTFRGPRTKTPRRKAA